MGNFIDKTFTVIADILLKILPASKQEKQAFSFFQNVQISGLNFCVSVGSVSSIDNIDNQNPNIPILDE